MTHRGIKIVLKVAALAIVLSQAGVAASLPVSPVFVTNFKCGNKCGLAREIYRRVRSDALMGEHRKSAAMPTGDRRRVVGRVRDGGLFGNGLATSRNLAGTFLTISSWVWNRSMAEEVSKRD